jgi:hypothetical protein
MPAISVSFMDNEIRKTAKVISSPPFDSSVSTNVVISISQNYFGNNNPVNDWCLSLNRKLAYR